MEATSTIEAPAMATPTGRSQWFCDGENEVRKCRNCGEEIERWMLEFGQPWTHTETNLEECDPEQAEPFNGGVPVWKHP